jgi:DNA topoisomerase I
MTHTATNMNACVAGRVQSVALRLVVEREEQRQLFVSQEYWSLMTEVSVDTAAAAAAAGAAPEAAAAARVNVLPAKLVEVDGQRLEQMSVTRRHDAMELAARLCGLSGGAAAAEAALVGVSNTHAALAAVESGQAVVDGDGAEVAMAQQQQQQQQLFCAPEAPVMLTVSSVTRRPVKRPPPPPYITSTLQQDASTRLRLSATRTMQIAQDLYEGAHTGASPPGRLNPAICHQAKPCACLY